MHSLSLTLSSSDAANHVFHFNGSLTLFLNCRSGSFKNEKNVCASYSCVNSSPGTNTIFIIICSACCVPDASQVSTPAFLLLTDVQFWLVRKTKTLQSLLHELGLWARAHAQAGSVVALFVHGSKSRLQSGVAPDGYTRVGGHSV